jgi:hypothetical protein
MGAQIKKEEANVQLLDGLIVGVRLAFHDW